MAIYRILASNEKNVLTYQVSKRFGSGEGRGTRHRRESAGGLARVMKEPQSVTRLYVSCLRVFHGVCAGRHMDGTWEGKEGAQAPR